MASRKARKRKSDHDINSKRVNKVPKEKKKGISVGDDDKKGSSSRLRNCAIAS